MPSIGRLYKYQEPSNIPGVRCDSGIEEGSEISMYYDPMICKLTAYGRSRDEAIKTSIKALDNYVIRGVTHNVPLLRDVLTEPRFRAGDFTTNYLPETYPDGFQPFGGKLSNTEINHLAGIAAVLYCKDQQRSREILNDQNVKNQRTMITSLDLTVKIAGESIRVTMDKKGSEFLVTTFVSKESILKGRQGDEMTIQDDFNLSDLVVKPEIRDSHGASKPSPFQLIYKRPNGVLRIRYKGTAINIPVVPTKAAELSMHMKEKPKLDTSKVVLSPMPGVVKSIAVEVGQLVGEGLECCVVEAMKMQNSMKAAITSKVKSINVKPGDTVEEDQILVELE